MPIPTEPIGSIPRSPELIVGMQQFAIGRISRDQLARLQDEGVRDTIKRFEATESPVITDGEQAKPSFATYPIHGLTNLAPDGVTIPFADGHTRQLLRDLVREAETDIRRCLAKGAHVVQLDFTEARLSVKLDPTKGLLKTFVDLNNQVLQRFSADEQQRIGVHSCPGGDRDSTHSADVDYAQLLPTLFELKAANFYIQCASETERGRVLRLIKQHLKPGQRIFVGVIDPIDPTVETPEEVRDRVLEAAEYIPLDRLGTTDDCGFAPFSDDTSTDRDTAFAKIGARVAGTALAARALRA